MKDKGPQSSTELVSNAKNFLSNKCMALKAEMIKMKGLAMILFHSIMKTQSGDSWEKEGRFPRCL